MMDSSSYDYDAGRVVYNTRDAVVRPGRTPESVLRDVRGPSNDPRREANGDNSLRVNGRHDGSDYSSSRRERGGHYGHSEVDTSHLRSRHPSRDQDAHSDNNKDGVSNGRRHSGDGSYGTAEGTPGGGNSKNTSNTNTTTTTTATYNNNNNSNSTTNTNNNNNDATKAGYSNGTVTVTQGGADTNNDTYTIKKGAPPTQSGDTNNDTYTLKTGAPYAVAVQSGRGRGDAEEAKEDREASRGRSRSTDRDREDNYYRGAEEKVPSVRRRHYDHMNMEDALQDKVATQLRENGVAETRVPTLSAKIAQAVRDDVIEATQATSPQVSQHLRDAIHNHLDPLLYNMSHVTDLGSTQRPADTPHMAHIVLTKLGQVHDEADACKLSVEDPPRSSRRGYTPREETDRSMLLQIKDGLEQQKTQNEIMQEKLSKAQRDQEDVDGDNKRAQMEAQELSAENWQLTRDLKEAERDKDSLIAKVREQQTDYDRLDKAYMDLKAENGKMKKLLNDGDNTNRSRNAELARLSAEKGRLQVLLDQKEKEILRLRDPDKEMLHDMKLQRDEVNLLRTQTQRLKQEKALLRSRLQKMEAGLDDSLKARNKLTQERDGLAKEAHDLRQRYRKVAMATPQARTLPDIMAGKNGPASSRATSRATSRMHRSGQSQEERDRRPVGSSGEGGDNSKRAGH